MGWEILPWYTLTDDFDTDFDVGEWHGPTSSIRDDDDRIFRTYFVDGRGDEALGGTWAYLDITALGRQEDWEDSPEGYPTDAGQRVAQAPRRVRGAGRLGGGRGDGRAGRARPGRGADEERGLMAERWISGLRRISSHDAAVPPPNDRKGRAR